MVPKVSRRVEGTEVVEMSFLSRHEAKLNLIFFVSSPFSNYVNTPSRIDISSEPMSRQVRLPCPQTKLSSRARKQASDD